MFRWLAAAPPRVWNSEDGMSTKAAIPLAMIVTALGFGAARGGDPVNPFGNAVVPASSNPFAAEPQSRLIEAPRVTGTPPTTDGSPYSPSTATGALTPSTGTNAPPGGLSSYITYSRPDCCGPIGCDGPIMTELFARTGPSLPVGGEFLSHLLDTGWMFEGGGRSLFYNPDTTAAWAVSAGISYTYNHARPDVITVQGQAVVMRDLNRVFFDATLGREWYVVGTACNCDGMRLRLGLDAGGRIGASSAEFSVIRHENDVVYGTILAGHTDLEFPRGCCTYLVGFRVEWDYTWTDITKVQHDIQDVNLLLNFGVRY
jgi:hypothetical protein